MDTLATQARSLAAAAMSFASRATWTDWVAYSALVLASYSLLSLARMYLGDADLQVRAAYARLPRTAFRGKSVWIVGASSGIGEALAYEVAARGGVVILSARRADRLESVAKACMAKGAAGAHVLVLDVEDEKAHAAAVARAQTLGGGRIDYLVNNAGRSERGLVERTEMTVVRQMFNLNVFAVMSLTKAALPTLLAQPKGAVLVTTSSVAGKLGSPISATYSASKHALQGFFDSVRMEMGGRNIRVVNVCPGPVHSEITLHAFTETAGKQLGDAKEEGTNRMPAERCAALMAAAMWAELPEVWIAPQPILFFTYVAQYWKGLYFRLGPKAGAKRVEAFKQGKSGYGAVQSVWSIASSGGAKKE